MPDILSYILILIFTATLLLIVFTLIYHLYISVKNIKDIRKKFIVIILLIIALIIYFPKPAGERKFNGNEKPQFTVKDCGCAGYNMQMGGKGSQIWQYKMYCYGIPLSCREYNQNHADLFKDE